MDEPGRDPSHYLIGLRCAHFAALNSGVSLHRQMTSATISEILRNELLQRQKRNARFSMRAFATLLNLDSGTLSQIMSGRRRPSKHMSMLLLQCLGFADERVTEMTAALELMKRENRLLRQIASTRFRPNSR